MKQLIILRKDLKNKKGEKIRTGKYITQASHAVLKVLLDSHLINNKIELSSDLLSYFNSDYKKICLSVNSEQELLDINLSLNNQGIKTSLITDLGFTEFNEPTITCLATYPSDDSLLDSICGHLSLF